MTARNQPTVIKVIGTNSVIDREYIVSTLRDFGFRDEFLAPHLEYLDERLVKTGRGEVQLINTDAPSLVLAHVVMTY